MERIKEGNLLGIKDVINTETSRINYLRGLIRIAECDNNKTSDEEGFIYKIAEIAGASYSELWKAEEKLEIEGSDKIHFETKKEKILFLMQALYLCWIDDDYSDLERKEIIAIGNELGITQFELEEVESWVKQGIGWMKTGAELLRLE